MDTVVANGLVVLSELVLSAYPMLIKLVDASIFFQTGLRMLVFTILAIAGAVSSGQPLLFSTLFSGETLATGILNLLHVFVSYTAFEKLAAGNAMALFYTYPVWNILGASLLFGETLTMGAIPWIGLALAGTIALAQPVAEKWNMIGVVAALLAALTETAIYLWFRAKPSKESEKPDDNKPWVKMIQLYGSSGILWMAFAVIGLLIGYLGANTFNLSSSGLSAILLFNSIVGFGGYALRFYMIPRVSTVIFSALSFLGVVTAYLFGWLGANEVPNMTQLLGALAIIVANTVLVSKENN
jgi:drug/metabolite transporter (DMT)-like permease